MTEKNREKNPPLFSENPGGEQEPPNKKAPPLILKPDKVFPPDSPAKPAVRRPRKKGRVFLVLFAVFLAGLLTYAWYPSVSLQEALRREGLTIRDLKRNRRSVRLVVHKADKTMDLIFQNRAIKRYRVSVGPGMPRGKKPRPVSDLELFFRGFLFFPGDKTWENDLRTPEGTYYLVTGFGPSRENYRFALLSYPDAAHRRKSARPGRDVGIHGMRYGTDWLGRLHTLIWHTRGCIALNNREIDELAEVAGRGTRVEIRP